MAYVISEPCIVKSICPKCIGIELCPTEAILSDMGFAYIDPELCIECGICEVACPHGVPHTVEPVFVQGHWKKMVTRKDQHVIALNQAAADAHHVHG